MALPIKPKFNPNVELAPQDEEKALTASEYDQTGGQVYTNPVNHTVAMNEHGVDPAPQMPRGTFGGEFRRLSKEQGGTMLPDTSSSPDWEKGLLDGFFGTDSSDWMNTMGVRGEARNDLFDQQSFLDVWGETGGYDTSMLDRGDVNAADSTSILNLLAGNGGSGGNFLDMRDQQLRALQQPGGSMMGLADVGQLLYADQSQDGMAGAALAGLDPGAQVKYITDLTMGAVSNSMPGMMSEIYASMMNEAGKEFMVAKSTGAGYPGDFRQFLLERGYAQTIFGMGGQ